MARFVVVDGLWGCGERALAGCPHIHGEQPLSAHASGDRSSVGYPAGQANGVHAQTLAYQAFATPIDEDRRHRAGQQERTHGLGDDGAWDNLQGACIAGCLKHARARLALTRLERATDE